MSMIKLEKIQLADLVVEKGFGFIEQNGLRESFACYIVDSSQLPNGAEIEAARGHPEVTALFIKAERLAERMTNKARVAGQTKLRGRSAQ